MGGERFFTDIPCKNNADGSSTLTVNGTQSINATADILEARSHAACAYAVVDTTKISPLVSRGKRGILLAQNRQVAVVQDELSLSDAATVTWRAYTPAKVVSASARTLLLELNGQQLLCKLSGAGNGRFHCAPVDDSGYTCISVESAVKGKFRMAVSFRLFREGDQKSEKFYDLRPISTWDQQ